MFGRLEFGLKLNLAEAPSLTSLRLVLLQLDLLKCLPDADSRPLVKMHFDTLAVRLVGLSLVSQRAKHLNRLAVVWSGDEAREWRLLHVLPPTPKKLFDLGRVLTQPVIVKWKAALIDPIDLLGLKAILVDDIFNGFGLLFMLPYDFWQHPHLSIDLVPVYLLNLLSRLQLLAAVLLA